VSIAVGLAAVIALLLWAAARDARINAAQRAAELDEEDDQ
jgi:hypothetical protein